MGGFFTVVIIIIVIIIIIFALQREFPDDSLRIAENHALNYIIKPGSCRWYFFGKEDSENFLGLPRNDSSSHR